MVMTLKQVARRLSIEPLDDPAARSLAAAQLEDDVGIEEKPRRSGHQNLMERPRSRERRRRRSDSPISR